MVSESTHLSETISACNDAESTSGFCPAALLLRSNAELRMGTRAIFMMKERTSSIYTKIQFLPHHESCTASWAANYTGSWEIGRLYYRKAPP